MFEWSDTDLIMRDTIRGFIDKEIRPNLDALETGEISPYPIARTRLTLATPGMGSLMSEPEEGELDLFSPANISPLVAYLATEKCPITGKVYAVQGGAISALSGWHDVDTIETDGVWVIDDIADRLPQ